LKFLTFLAGHFKYGKTLLHLAWEVVVEPADLLALPIQGGLYEVPEFQAALRETPHSHDLQPG
jgi:hypothetical protein